MWGTRRQPQIMQVPLGKCFFPRVLVWSFWNSASTRCCCVTVWIKSSHQKSELRADQELPEQQFHLHPGSGHPLSKYLFFMEKPVITFSFTLPWRNLHLNFILLNKIISSWVPKSGQIYWTVSTAHGNSNDAEGISLLSVLESSEKSI